MLTIIVSKNTQAAVSRVLATFGLPADVTTSTNSKYATMRVETAVLEDVGEVIDALYASNATLTVAATEV